MEYQINKFIKLKLENDQTVIYVNSEYFNQCKRLFVSIPTKVIPEINTNEISMDEIAEKYGNSEDIEGDGTYSITPEEEFWVHCSNLQVWAEMNYNTNILHSNIAFPLLKKLTDVGDPLAKRVFKEEIAKRFEKGRSQSTVKYLLEEGYLDYLGDEEFIDLIVDNDALLHIGNIFYSNYILSVLKERKILNNIRVKERLIDFCKEFIDAQQKSFKKKESMIYLFEEGYLDYLNDEQYIDLVVNNDVLLHTPRNVLDLLKERNLFNDKRTKEHLIDFCKKTIAHTNTVEVEVKFEDVEDDPVAKEIVEENIVVFSILKELTKIGDLCAKKIFTEEIVKRFEKGRSRLTMIYLLNEEYLNVLDNEDFLDLVEKISDLLCNDQEVNGIIPFLYWRLPSGGNTMVRVYILDELIKRKLINNNRVKRILIELGKVKEMEYDLGQKLSLGLYSEEIEKLDTEIIDLLLYNREFISCVRSYLRYDLPNLIKVYKEIVIRRLKQGDYKAIVLINKESMIYWKPDELFNLIFPILPNLLVDETHISWDPKSKKVKEFTISLLEGLNEYGHFPEIEKILKEYK